ncbi:hypothetical protein KPL70_022363 [Citrus sinensis]|nr:hypothetical protein KPL70_022363 [Citrus sinensis]
MAALQLFILFVALNVVLSSSRQIITTLPGFDGDLPFKLETGYIGVGENDNVQLFYYFIESERSPEDDPLVLWLSGGPGCSGFWALAYQLGPLSFDYENSRENSPKLLLNPYSWTKVASIIFIDAPAGTGFSYVKNWQGFVMNDTLSAVQTYFFLRKWLIAHPSFLANPLYIFGESYSGKVLPIVVQKISDGIDLGDEPRMNLKGYVLGNPVTDEASDMNFRPQFAYMKGLITHEIYESAKRNCRGEYTNADPSNGLCKADLQNITANIYEPQCSLDILRRPVQFIWDRAIIEEDSFDFLYSPVQSAPSHWCRKDNYFYSYNWANNKAVQKALRVREGTVEYWTRCNKSLSYTSDVSSGVDYHRKLTKKGYQVLVYSGDVDMVVPYMATEAWIKSLNLTIETGWQPWLVESQVAGPEKLALSRTSLRGLPEEMKALVNLRYLNLEETSKMSRIPKQLISSISKLQVLRMLKCSGSVLSDDAEPLMKELLCLEHLDVISLTLDCSRANVIPILFKYRKLVSVTQSLEISSFWFSPRLNASDLANLASMEKLGELNFMLCNFEEFKSTGDVEKVLQSRFRSLRKIVINGCEVKDLTWLVFVPNL